MYVCMYVCIYVCVCNLGNNWSALFDSEEPMKTLLRIVMATVTHLNGVSESKNTATVVKGSLPNTGAQVDDTVLAAGMFAGVNLSVWEMGEAGGENLYPSDIIYESCVFKPSDVVKIKVGADDDYIGYPSIAISLISP